MKILFITNQIIETRPSGYWCNFALFGTISNMRILGDIYILANNIPMDGKMPQPITEHLDFIGKNRVEYLYPTKSIKHHFRNNSRNKFLLEKLIEGKDLVIGYAPSMIVSYSQKISQKRHIPFLTFLVGSPWDVLIHHRKLLAKLIAPISYYSTRQLLKNSDYVHYVTHSYLQKKYPTKGKALGCSDINIGKFDLEAFDRRVNRLRLSKNTKTIIKLITVGSIDAGYKGQEFVMKAMARLKAKGNNKYRYYLIGGQKGDRLHRICHQLNLDNDVVFLGVKKIDEVFAWLDNCDIYLQPSLTEGLPRSVIEAMSRALPCIGFNSGGIPELLEQKYIIKQRDSDGIAHALEVLENPQEYERAAKRNFFEAQKYEHSILQEKIRNFYLQIKKDLEENGMDRKNK